MVMLTGTLQHLGKIKALVVGDMMLDAYTIGKVKRISPEAPVAVIHVQKEEQRPGGAGNVMLNLRSLGADVVALGRIGEDFAGKTLAEKLQEEGIDTSGLMVQHGYPTPVKNRIIAENQQIVRIDHESVEPLHKELEKKIIQSIPQLMEDVKIVAISDYGKGLLTLEVLKAIIQQARQKGIPVIADPKGNDFIRYAGATVIKPNLSEAYAAAGMSFDVPMNSVADRILTTSQIDALMITRSEAGISVFHRNGTVSDFPVRVREVKDVTGAGDTVLAMLACAMANGLSLDNAAQLANVAAGIAIERFGCARVSISDLARRLLEDNATNKIFDDEHLFALKQALNGHHWVMLGIDGTQALSPNLFKEIQRFAERENSYLIIYLCKSNSSDDLSKLLVSLHQVDFVLRPSRNLSLLSQCLHPNEIYLYKDNQLHALKTLEEMIGQ